MVALSAPGPVNTKKWGGRLINRADAPLSSKFPGLRPPPLLTGGGHRLRISPCGVAADGYNRRSRDSIATPPLHGGSAHERTPSADRSAAGERASSGATGLPPRGPRVVDAPGRLPATAGRGGAG